MRTITIGRIGCDIIIPDNCISRKHAAISLVNGQYVYNDMSKNGTAINGRIYRNEKVVVTPGTPVYLSNKVSLPWPQVLMLLPNAPINGQMKPSGANGTIIHSPFQERVETIGAGWGILSFLFPVIGFILYFVWKDSSRYKAKQAANIAWISIGISFVIGFISGLTL